MRPTLLLGLCLTAACQPAPTAPPPPTRTIELYMHANGLSRCVEEDGDRWKADASCCPEGFELAGFSVPAVTEYAKQKDGSDEIGVTRRLYRHVVCIER